MCCSNQFYCTRHLTIKTVSLFLPLVCYAVSRNTTEDCAVLLLWLSSPQIWDHPSCYFVLFFGSERKETCDQGEQSSEFTSGGWNQFERIEKGTRKWKKGTSNWTFTENCLNECMFRLLTKYIFACSSVKLVQLGTTLSLNVLKYGGFYCSILYRNMICKLCFIWPISSFYVSERCKLSFPKTDTTFKHKGH